MLRVIFGLVIAFLLTANSAAKQQPDDWAAFRGNNGTGNVKAGSLLASGEVNLKVRWKKKLGSGYSGISIVGDQIVTMYAGQQYDMLVCLDAASGKGHWQIPIDNNYKGHDGSFDGPVSTPAISDDTIVALSAQGKLIAANLADGKLRWERSLTAAPISATAPMYGFCCCPIIVDDVVVVICGGQDSFLCGFDLKSGEILWRSENDQIQCQSPVLMKLAGQQVVVAAGMTKLFGFDPKTGNKIFEHLHQGSGARGAFSIVPVQLDEQRIFTAHDDRSSSVVSVTKKSDTFETKTTLTTRAIQNTYNVPVLHDGKIFGYNNRILTACDASTGQQLWKSREPGDAFHIIVDGHLILATKKGDLVVGTAGEKEFQPIANVKVFDNLVWSLPSFSKNSIYVRSLGEIARIDLVSASGNETAVSELTLLMPMATEFSKFILKLTETSNKSDRAKLIDDFVAKHPSSPFIDQGIAHFYYRGSARDVAIGSGLFGARQEKKMVRIDDFFYHCRLMEPDQRAEYSYFVDFNSTDDPRSSNPSFQSAAYVDDMEVAVSTMGDTKPVNMSWFAMPAWKPPSYQKAIKSDNYQLKGTIDRLAVLKDVAFDVYLPEGYADSKERYSVVYVHSPEARVHGKIEVAVDHLIQAGKLKPLILVFLPVDTGDPKPENYPSFIGKKLVPAVDRQLRTLADRKHRSTYSAGFLGPMGMLTVAKNAELIGATAVQSPFIFGAAAEGAFDELKKIKQPMVMYCDWGRHDMFNPHENWDMRTVGKRIFNEARAIKNFNVVGGIVPDTTGWYSWRNRYEEIFKVLLDRPQ